MPFIREAAYFKQIMIRPDEEEKIRKAWDNEMLIQANRACLKWQRVATRVWKGRRWNLTKQPAK